MRKTRLIGFVSLLSLTLVSGVLLPIKAGSQEPPQDAQGCVFNNSKCVSAALDRLLFSCEPPCQSERCRIECTAAYVDELDACNNQVEDCGLALLENEFPPGPTGPVGPAFSSAPGEPN